MIKSKCVRKINVLSEDTERDIMINMPRYQEKTLREEKHLLKIIKLSFYFDASKEEKETYLKYFCEENPSFKQKMKSDISNIEKAQILQKAIEFSKEVRDNFVAENMRLVMSIATNYLDRGVPYADLIQEGTFGIMKAIEKFDIEKNNKFSTYATQWIRHYINRYILNNGQIIKLSVHTSEILYKLPRAEKDLFLKNGQKPTNKELADYLKVSEKQISIAKNSRITVKSLDLPVEEDSKMSLGELIIDDNTEDILTTVITSITANEIKDLLNKSNLDKKLLTVLYARYGLDDDKPKTLSEIGIKMGYGHERIRQFEKEALIQLRNSEEFISYYDDYQGKSKEKKLQLQ